MAQETIEIEKTIHPDPDYPGKFMYAMKVPGGMENEEISKEFSRRTGIPEGNFLIAFPDHFASDQEVFFPPWHDAVNWCGFKPRLGEDEREYWIVSTEHECGECY